MPEISRFFGIVIAMYYREHGPPHFHARYGEHEARIEIEAGTLLSGSLPPRAQRLVNEWLQLHRAALIEDWQLAAQKQALRRITPLE
jgi:hypothetical protein